MHLERDGGDRWPRIGDVGELLLGIAIGSILSQVKVTVIKYRNFYSRDLFALCPSYWHQTCFACPAVQYEVSLTLVLLCFP